MSTRHITPFQVRIADDELEGLRARLASTRLPHDFANSDWHYGVEREWLESMIHYWAHDFDWRAQESAINELPQFMTEIDSVPIHFVHLKSGSPDAVPIVLSHGWPWTFWDWNQVIRELAAPRADGRESALAFDIVVPSLPGFAFSSPLNRSLNCREVAGLWDRLMTETLGYPRYLAAGGDWGGKITGELAQEFPDHVIGGYTTLQAVPGRTPSLEGPERFAPDEQWMPVRMAQALPHVVSHLAVHRHDPQTLGYALNDSPAGLAAWIWERRVNWVDPATRDAAMADREFLCTTASLFWFTQTITTSMRFYRDNFGDRQGVPRTSPSGAPMGFGITPQDVLYLPRAEAEQSVTVRHWSFLPAGGHFSAYEAPVELASDIREFCRSVLTD